MIMNCVSFSLRKMFKLDAHLFGRYKYFLHLTDQSAYLEGRDQEKKGSSEGGEGESGTLVGNVTEHCRNLNYIISIILSDHSID